MSDITLHTGSMGDWNTIKIDWFDENNVRQTDQIDVIIEMRDKPRVLSIRVNGRAVATIPAGLPNDRTKPVE